MAGNDAIRAPVERDPLQLRSEARLASFDDDEGPTNSIGGDLRSLALKGAWSVVAEQTANFVLAEPDALLVTAAWHIMALAKLQKYAAAAEGLASLGDLDSPEYSSATPQGMQSRVPFALRILSCELPSKLGRWKDSQDSFYNLLDFCQQQAEMQCHGADSIEHSAHRKLWRGREERVVASLFSQHMRLRDYCTALQWLSWLRERHPDSLELLSTVGCVQLAIGHVNAAAATFQAVSKIVIGRGDANQVEQLLVRRNRGLLLFAQNDWTGAAAEFDCISAAVPGDPVAANNAAVCRMYAGNLMAAVQALEGSLRDEPTSMLNEVILSNLSGMYDLCSPNTSPVSKRNLAAWVAKVAPDDLDKSCLR